MSATHEFIFPSFFPTPPTEKQTNILIFSACPTFGGILSF